MHRTRTHTHKLTQIPIGPNSNTYGQINKRGSVCFGAFNVLVYVPTWQRLEPAISAQKGGQSLFGGSGEDSGEERGSLAAHRARFLGYDRRPTAAAKEGGLVEFNGYQVVQFSSLFMEKLTSSALPFIHRMLYFNNKSPMHSHDTSQHISACYIHSMCILHIWVNSTQEGRKLKCECIFVQFLNTHTHFGVYAPTVCGICAPAQCVVCANRFTALRPAQLPSPLFIATINAPPAPALTSEAAPASPADQSAPRPLEMNRFPGTTEAISRPPPRSDQASSTNGERRPRLPCVACVCVCVGVCSSASGSGGLQRLTGQRDTRVNPGGIRQKPLPLTPSQ